MHVHDDTAHSHFPGRVLVPGSEEAALTPRSHLALVRGAPAQPVGSQTPLGTQGSAPRQSSSALGCHGPLDTARIRIKSIEKGQRFPSFTDWEAKKEQGS